VKLKKKKKRISFNISALRSELPLVLQLIKKNSWKEETRKLKGSIYWSGKHFKNPE